MNRRLAGTAMLVFALIGCSDKSTPIGPPPPPSREGPATPQRLTIAHHGNLTSADFTGWTIGAKRTFSADVRYSDGSNKKATAVWSIDNMDVATIDESGEGRGVGSGEATVTAQAEGLTGTVKVRVVPSYEGTWEGDYVVRTCRASGTFDAGSWCGDELFKDGVALPIRVVLKMYDDDWGGERVSIDGEVFLGKLRHRIELIGIDGDVKLRASLSIGAGNQTAWALLDPFPAKAQGDALLGSFSYTIQAPDLAGSVTVDAELRSVTRISASTSISTWTAVLLSDLPRLIRPR